MSKVIIYRGLPGSGKSTLADKECDYILEADQFFDLNPDQDFDPSLLPEAHAWCLKKFIKLMSAEDWPEEVTIAVANTNISAAEIAPYYAIAEAYGWGVEIKTLEIDPSQAFHRNVHNVPMETVQKMYNKLLAEELFFAPWWKHSRYAAGVR